MELDKLPIHTPYVVSYDRTRTAEGITESSAYLKRYYSMIDAEIYFCNYYVEDIMSINWQINQQTQPLFGYNSYIYDEVAQGSRIISGSFVINFTSPNYLMKLLDSIQENEATVMKNFTVKAKKRITDGVGNTVKTVNKKNDGDINYPKHNAIWTKTFDIDVIFGHKTDSYSNPVHIVLEGVKILNSHIGASADGAGRPNIFEEYNFLAQNITTSDNK